MSQILARLKTLLPYTSGLLVALAPPERRGSTWNLLAVPSIACPVLGVVPLPFAWQVVICVVMALPIFVPRADGRTRLHLTSRHRLTTRFNWYAGPRTEPTMSEIQGAS